MGAWQDGWMRFKILNLSNPAAVQGLQSFELQPDVELSFLYSQFASVKQKKTTKVIILDQNASTQQRITDLNSQKLDENNLKVILVFLSCL